jgi:hypothetical protein
MIRRTWHRLRYSLIVLSYFHLILQFTCFNSMNVRVIFFWRLILLLFGFRDLLFNPFVYVSSVCLVQLIFLLFDFWDLLFNPFVYCQVCVWCNLFFIHFDFWDLYYLTLLCTFQVCVWSNLYFYSLWLLILVLFNPFVYLSSVCLMQLIFLLFDCWDFLFNPFVYLSSVCLVQRLGRSWQPSRCTSTTRLPEGVGNGVARPNKKKNRLHILKVWWPHATLFYVLFFFHTIHTYRTSHHTIFYLNVEAGVYEWSCYGIT